MFDVIQIVVGLVLLLFGGDLIVRGASNLAKSLGISPLIIGLTVVAFGTSVPELAVNVSGALNGRGELCFGNVIGSNIANIGLILGLAAIVAPVVVQRPIVLRDIPIMLLSVLIAVVQGLDRWLDGTPNGYSRSDALCMLLVFCVFLYTTTWDVLKGRESRIDVLVDEDAKVALPPRWKNVLMALGGLVLLAVGGDTTVSGAVGVARMIGLSEIVIGLTIVSIGTSLPELATTIIAARRKETDLAVGNIVGSNIFNLLLVLGTSTAISPTLLPDDAFYDFLVLMLLSFGLLPMAITGWRLDRKEGFVLFFIYIGYLTWRVWASLGS